jgi:DNA polymerase I-like protein with 3'-5' exonuclease and polymerase domains/uracil-DNA glycosylase
MLQRSCDSCPYGGVKVSHRGPLDSPLVIVGDGPSPIELAKKRIFAGPTQSVIEQMLEKSGFAQMGIEPLYINAIECFAGDKTTGNKKAKDPKSGVTITQQGGKHKYVAALKSCHNRLLDVIAMHPRRMVIALGAGAMHSMCNDYSLKITHERGGLVVDGLSEKGTFITTHPTFILKGGGSLQQYQDDFHRAAEIYKEGLQRRYYDAKFTTLETISQVKALCKLLKRHGNKPVAADIETGGFDFWKDEILELGVSLNGKFVYIIPDHLLTPELFENKCKWIWHNGKFDIKFLWAYKIPEARVDEDTMLLSYVMDEVKGIHGLEQVAWDWLGAPDYKDMLKPYLANKNTSYREIPADVRRKYLALDVGRTFQLLEPMRKALDADKDSKKCYERILIPGSNYLARVEWNGFKTDRTWVKAHMDEMEAEIEKCQEEFQNLAIKSWGKTVNTNSPKQLQQYLYGHLKLAHRDQATDKDTLEALPSHPCLEPLLRIRKLQKYLSTYIYPCWYKVDFNGRVHASYNLHGTKTGRLSSNGPNMQNIPRLKAVRGMFMAEEGKILIECDLSQAELRSLAQLSGDAELCRIYNSNELSLHDEVTAEIFPAYTLPETSKEEKKELKMRGKAVNFGIVYGRQAFSFVAEFGISMAEAQRWIGKWFVRFPKAKEYIDKCRQAVDKGQTLVTVFGRKRRFGAITQERRQKLQNEASNFPHQSTASDITLLAGILCEPLLRTLYDARIVNTVHDCIVIEADPKYKDAICRMVTEAMVRIPREWGFKRVPFESEAEIGERWGHLEGYHGFLLQEHIEA